MSPLLRKDGRQPNPKDASAKLRALTPAQIPYTPSNQGRSRLLQPPPPDIFSECPKQQESKAPCDLDKRLQ